MENPEESPTQAEALISYGRQANCFHTPDGDGFATISVGDHWEVWPIRSKWFRQWLVKKFYDVEGKPPGGQALIGAIGVLEAWARFEGAEHEVFLRLAQIGDTIYLDLCNPQWECVEVKPTGWRVISDPPCKFRRTKGMSRLPCPESGGSLDELRQLVNAPDDEQWCLIVAWLLASLRPSGPFPILCLQGEQGSAKSSTARILRALIDPSISPLRTMPREERDLMIAAKNGWTLVFDNISGISPWLSDALCRLATGGGFSTRELYSDAEEVIFDAMRPSILNGIDDIVSRNDLIDRALIVTLPRIGEGHRKTEEELRQEFEQAQPRILGALLSAVSKALGNLPTVKLQNLPRMADFAKWAVAAEPALGWGSGTFMSSYLGNRRDAVEIALESDHVAVAIRAFIDGKHESHWSGTAADLLAFLSGFADERVKVSKSWPKSPRALSGRVRRAATFLRSAGIDVEFSKESGTRRRLVTLRQVSENSVPTVPSVPDNAQTVGSQIDATGTINSLSSPQSESSSSQAENGRDGADAKFPPDSTYLDQAVEEWEEGVL